MHILAYIDLQSCCIGWFANYSFLPIGYLNFMLTRRQKVLTTKCALVVEPWNEAMVMQCSDCRMIRVYGKEGNGKLKRTAETENGRGLALKTPKTKPKTLKPSPLTVQSREGILTRAFGPR